MYTTVIFLSFCFIPFSTSEESSVSTIMSHENWKYLPNINACGQNRHRTRIVGGHKAQIGRYPWFIRLGYANDHNQKQIDFRCGGTLINERFVLTAAHCVQGYEKKIRVVRLGDNLPHMPPDCTNGKCAPNVRDFLVDDIIMFPEFNLTTFKGDIALIRLKDDVQFNAFIQPVCLPRDKLIEKSWFGEQFTVIGWGRDEASAEELSTNLRYVDLPMRDMCACASVYDTAHLDDSQLCVGLEQGLDSCDGDSGGPLTWVNRESLSRIHYQVGLVSFGKSICGEAPSIYTNVIYYLPWLLDNINATNEVDENETW